ncbi:MAG: tetratricopeptide repeat protein [Pseudohongiellaceae bacterium]
MNSLRGALLTIALLVCLPVEGDQNDPRLDELFSVLEQSSNRQELRVAENRIWEIWMQHPDEDAARLLAVATDRMNRQQIADAMALFNGVIEQYPNFAEAWNKRATLHYLLGDHAASIEDIHQALELEPRHFGAISGLGLVYLQQDDLMPARAAFQRLLRIYPHSTNALENLRLIDERIRTRFI